MKLNTSFSVPRDESSEISTSHDAIIKVKPMPIAFQLMTIILITTFIFFLVSKQLQKKQSHLIVPLPPRPVPDLKISLPLKIAVLDQLSINLFIGMT